MAEKSEFIIDIFMPPFQKKIPVVYDYLENCLGKSFKYAVKGRYALWHIINATTKIKRILLPIYICDTVVYPLKALGIDIIYYDLSLTDLNADLESISTMIENYDVQAILVASMYGNPAALKQIEEICGRKGVFLIDDAAQSFGAKLDGRYVGTFGDSGFFSISPGKPLAGHLGAFFWTKNAEYEIRRTQNWLYHYIAYKEFYYNRLKRYEYNKRSSLLYFKILLEKLIDLKNSELEVFEERIIFRLLWDVLEGGHSYRKFWQEQFSDAAKGHDKFKVISNVRGESSPHKLVLVLPEKKQAEKFMNYLWGKRIYCRNGYSYLTDDLSRYPNASKLKGCIVEVPLEEEEQKMEYLKETIFSFK